MHPSQMGQKYRAKRGVCVKLAGAGPLPVRNARQFCTVFCAICLRHPLESSVIVIVEI